MFPQAEAEQHMPVSKKPRRKAATKAKRNVAAVREIPDRRTMESFLATLAGRPRDEVLARAQDVMYQAWESNTSRARVAYARQALAISPLCADAYNLLAEEAATIADARDLYAKGVEAGELALGPEGFKEYAEHFWGFLETRPYMRARAGLAAVLLKLGDEDAAIGHYRAMLELNPNDNQGVRYVLAALLLRRGDEAALKALLAAYEGEASAYWLYTRALLAFREGSAGEKQAAELAQQAWSSNEHVPAILAGTKRPVVGEGGYITMGGADEATDYIAEFGSAWRSTSGAIEWLIRTVSNRLPKRQGKSDIH
jgi:tetratricopeptide (TPR) repeat protein